MEESAPHSHTLLLTAIHPLPLEAREQYDHFAHHVTQLLHTAQLLPHATVYTLRQLHVTVATLQSKKCARHQMTNNLSAAAATWHSILAPLTVAPPSPPAQPKPPLCLRLDRCDVFDDYVAVLRWSDPANRMQAYRARLCAAVRNRCAPHNGEGSEVSDAITCCLHVPSIIHSTVVRWVQDVAHMTSKQQLQGMLNAAFAKTWTTPLTITVRQVHITEELAPCLAQATVHYVLPI